MIKYIRISGQSTDVRLPRLGQHHGAHHDGRYESEDCGGKKEAPQWPPKGELRLNVKKRSM